MDGRTTTLAVALLCVLAAGPAVGTAAGGPAAPTAADATNANAVSATEPAGGTLAGAGTGAGAATRLQTSCAFPYSATDATGTEVTLEERPERVTTLNPSAAQTMWEIGGREQVVGVTQYASYLEGADSRTNVSSSGFGASVEKVVGTNPDLVLAPNATSKGTVEKLREAGLTVYHFPAATTIEDVREKTTRIGRLTGNCAGAAEANAWMTANVEAAREATADVEPVRVLYPLGGGYIAGTETFISAMLSAAGGRNVAAERNLSGYPQISDEVVLELDPQYLVVTGYSSYLLGREPYNSTAAVANDNVVRVNRNWMNQPAPRSVVMGVRKLTRGFHPEAASEVEFPTRAEAVAAMETPTPTPSPTPTATATQTATATSEPDTTAESTEASGPGFGFGAALAALAGLSAAGLARRRRTA